MNDSISGDKPETTQPKTPDSISLFRGVPVFASKRGRNPKQSKVEKRLEMYDRRVNKNRSSDGQKPDDSINPPSSEEDDTPHYFTNGPGDVLVPLPELQAIVEAPDRDQQFQIIRLYHVDGITWAVCDDCAINRFPRGFEGSKVVSRVGCAHCRCLNALQTEDTMLRWLALGRPAINPNDPPRGV